MTTGPLPSSPGSTADPGSEPAVVALFDTLFDDAAIASSATDPATGVAVHERNRAAWYADLVGPAVVPAGAAQLLAEALSPSHHRLRILLAAGPASDPTTNSATDSATDPTTGPGSATAADPEQGRQGLRAARDLLAEDDRVELVGVRLAPPGAGGAAMAHLLGVLDFSVPAWVAVGPGPGADDALRVLAADGAENLTMLPGPGLAQLLRTAVDLGLAFRIAAGDAGRSAAGLLGAVCAVRTALLGAPAAELAEILAGADPAPLAAAVRGLSEADAAAVRAALVAVEAPDVAALVAELVGLGLVTPPPD